MSRRGMTQYEVDNQQNITLIDSHWDHGRDDDEWDDEEVFEDDELDEF